MTIHPQSIQTHTVRIPLAMYSRQAMEDW